MSSATNSGSGCIVVASEISHDRSSLCRPGDAKWTPVFSSSEIDLSCEIHGVAFCDGRFYAADRHGKIWVPPFHSKNHKLLEWNGELLLFGVGINDEAEPRLYKCDDPMGESLTKSKVDSLEENSVFLSEDHFPAGFLGHELHAWMQEELHISLQNCIHQDDGQGRWHFRYHILPLTFADVRMA